MKYFFKNNKKPDLCLVFCGWGTDENLYLPVLKDFDYLLYFDYDKELKFELPVDCNKYKNIYLLSYSAGGIFPALLKDKLPDFTMTAAVNASVRLFGEYGLSDDTVKLIRGLNSSNYLDFRKQYLTENEEEFELFNKHQPLRSFESCFRELDNLLYIAKQNKDCYYSYDKIYSAKNDKMISFDAQKNFFGNNVIKINGGHFPFYRYASLKEFFS